jgi:hypothetical protein
MEINDSIFEKLTTKPFDSDHLFNHLSENIDSIITNLKNKTLKFEIVCRAIHKLTESNSVQAIEILSKLDFNHYPLYSLKIREYSKTKENLKEARDIITDLPPKMHKKRIYMPILKALIEWYPVEAFSYLIEVSKRFELSFDDISDFFEGGAKEKFAIDYEILFNIVSENQIIINSTNFEHPVTRIKDVCPHCNNHIKRIEITDEEIRVLIENFKTEYLNKVSKLQSEKSLTVENKYEEITKFDEFCEGKNYRVFIDGANVLRHLNQPAATIEGYQRLFKIYMKLFRGGHHPLVILHQSHRNNIKRNFKNKEIAKVIRETILGEMDVFYTPNYMNDDEFFIWGALHTQNGMVVTNDQFRDHIFKISDEDIHSKTLVKWMQNSIISYKSKHKLDIKANIRFPRKVSYVAQKNEDNWHIPIGNGKWMCISS